MFKQKKLKQLTRANSALTSIEFYARGDQMF